jgi:hypothetical protein
VLANLNAASGQIDRLFTDLPPFANSARPAIRSLGRASVTGRQAVTAANPTISHLDQFALATPELGQNLKIVLDDLDTQSRAVESDPRSPGGKGFTGLQALLGYVFNQTLAINTTNQYGHMLAVDAFVDFRCTPYATPDTIATNLKVFGKENYRQCYSWLGPSQPGVNEPDPTNPSAPVPDPGGAPPGETGPSTSAAALDPSAASVNAERAFARSNGANVPGGSSTTATTGSKPSVKPLGHHRARRRGRASTGSTAGAAAGSSAAQSNQSSASSTPPISLSKTVGALLGVLGVGGSRSQQSPPQSGDTSSGSQAQQLLNYLLAP